MNQYKLPSFPLFKNIVHYATNSNGIAIEDVRMNTSFSYIDLAYAVANLKAEILNGKR
jgi:hypothetical protein